MKLKQMGPCRAWKQTGPLRWALTVCQTLWGTLYIISTSYKADTFKSPICRWEAVLLMIAKAHRGLIISPSRPTGGRSGFQIRSIWQPTTVPFVGEKGWWGDKSFQYEAGKNRVIFLYGKWETNNLCFKKKKKENKERKVGEGQKEWKAKEFKLQLVDYSLVLFMVQVCAFTGILLISLLRKVIEYQLRPRSPSKLFAYITFKS